MKSPPESDGTNGAGTGTARVASDTMAPSRGADEFNGGLYTSLVANSPAQYEELLRAVPADPTALLQLGLIEQARGRQERASEWFQRACEADPEIEWYVLPDAPDPGPHRGRRAILERAALWRDMLALRGEVFEFIDAGEYVIMPVRMRGRPPGSDAEVVLDEVYVGKFRDGKVVELREYRTRAEALEAVGD